MESLRSSSSKNNGIAVISLFITGVLCSGGVFSEVSDHLFPSGGLTLSLALHPLSPTITLKNIPLQDAQIDFEFKLPIRQFIVSSHPQMTYRLANGFFGVNSVYAVNMTTAPLPNGVKLVSTWNGDCVFESKLYQNSSCNVHFDIDPDTLQLPAKGTIPQVIMGVYWEWGNGRADSMSYPTAALPQHDMLAVVPSIISPIIAKVQPVEQDGLYYDPGTLSIKGKPTRAGVYTFNVSATNGNSTTDTRKIEIKVNIDPKDKPVFKTVPIIASATPDKEYLLNLIDLLEPNDSFMTSNQITFTISKEHEYPSWLEIDANNPTVLRGKVPKSEVGMVKTITLFAHSNRGGASDPLTLQIPIAYDVEKKPVIKTGVELSSAVGESFRYDIRNNIVDPTADGSLKLSIDKIEPEAKWLSVSNVNPTELIGMVPDNVVGQIYQITLSVSNQIGGPSESVTIPLQINIDKNQTPKFYAANPNLPLLYEGQKYEYDFIEQNDVVPEYKDVPYQIELAPNQNNPDWIRIEENKLKIVRVPENLPQKISVFVTIKNTPGGISHIYNLNLYIMN